MTNLTLVVDDDVLKRARLRAVDQGTSVNALVRDFLGDYASEGDAARRARQRLLELAQDSTASSAGQAWSRDELYD